jgi:hypothetical protein
MGIIHAFKYQYRKQFIQNATAMIEGELLGDAGSPDLGGCRKTRRRKRNGGRAY